MVRGAKTIFSPEALEYLAEHSRQDDVLARVERETSELPNSQMQISPDQGAMMHLLAKLVEARNALEVGTFTGYSAICVARALADGGKLTCLELDPEFAAVAQANLEDAGVAERVEIVVGPAADSLRAMPEEPAFDFVFLDADKTGYAEYYDLILPRMLPGGLLLIDNVLLNGDVVAPDDDRSRLVADLNDRIVADERVDSAFALIADGVAFVRKR
jgi:caffeoyl-CoA O-methyltransferase